jgi:hypothetical protein
VSTRDLPDLSGVSPQRTYLQSHPRKPEAASTLYIQRFTTKHADESESHTVTGVHIVLAPGQPNGLWEALHVDRNQLLDPLRPRVATRELLVCCDTLEVRGAFSLPEAAVSVFARRVIWATEDAAIDTSPLRWSVKKAQGASGSTPGASGAAGRHAGSIRLFAGEMAGPVAPGPRLVAEGGGGQDAGAGLDGSDGASLWSSTREHFTLEDKELWGTVTSKADVSFSPPAVYIDFGWYWGAKLKGGKRGEDAFPGNGTDAVAPGAPGGGGNGGALTTNLAEAARLFRNGGGQPGARERDYRGGSAGSPSPAAKYALKLRHDVTGTDSAGYDLEKTAEHTSTAGKDAPAPPSHAAAGATPQPTVLAAPNAWLHPLGLQPALEYARELFLANARDELFAFLSAYDAALAHDPPAGTGAWGDGTEAQWSGAQGEVASMLQRLHANLDYFGNGAGFTPRLSLQSAFRLYDEETGRALRTLMLARWIAAQEHDAKEAAAALGDAITTLNAESRAAAERIVAAEARVADGLRRADGAQKELNGLSSELGRLRSTLEARAQNDLEAKARIRFGIRMAAAICQLVPVGQPMLGTLGNLASAAADLVGDDDGTKLPDTVSKIGGVIEKANAAARKAEEAKKKAKKEKDDGEEAEAKTTPEAKEAAKRWAQVGKGLGPAISQAGKAMKELQVPAEEVEAELQRLEAQSPEWQALTRKIRDVNGRKAAIFGDIAAGLQALGEGYARVSSNAAAVFGMQQERARTLGRLDPAAAGFVREMAQRSRLTLLRYLYLMVRSYETTVLVPIDVDWNLAAVTSKLATLVQPGAGYDAASLAAAVKALRPVFEKNLDTVRAGLLELLEFRESTDTLQYGLSTAQTPDLLAALNTGGRVTLDPLACGLLFNDIHMARLSKVELKTLEIEPQGPQLSDTHNLKVTVAPASAGTLRRGERLYAVYSDLPGEWSWTRMASGEIVPADPSQASKDMLDLVLGKDAGAVRQKVALPPVWSDLEVRVSISPELPASRRPRLTGLYFRFHCDGTPAPGHQRVLTVRHAGAVPGAIVSCAPADLDDRGAGLGQTVRVYPAGATVRLSVPARVGGARFEGWDLGGALIDRTNVKTAEVDVPMDGHVLAVCRWTREDAAPMPRGRLAARASVDTHALRGVSSRLPIRAAADATAHVVSVAPALRDVEVLETAENGWMLVNHGGIVGWIGPHPAASEAPAAEVLAEE